MKQRMEETEMKMKFTVIILSKEDGENSLMFWHVEARAGFEAHDMAVRMVPSVFGQDSDAEIMAVLHGHHEAIPGIFVCDSE